MKRETMPRMIVLSFLIVIIAIAVIRISSIGREFPIDGRNVSDLDTNRIAGTITQIATLDDASQLCVSEDAFDLMFTSDFDWANDGAIRFFYVKNHKTYSSQLRMFHDTGKYFVTDCSEQPEQAQSFKLIHYLDALKHLPQQEIRRLSPDADGYCVFLRNDGIPENYPRILKYNKNGIAEFEGWIIHLEVQPLRQVPGSGYSGSGDEVIHIFYNHQT